MPYITFMVQTSRILIDSSFTNELRCGYPGINHIVHGREDRILATFEEVLIQFEPMISASLRRLNIYRNHENFK